MLTKEEIQALKTENNGALVRLLQDTTDAPTLLWVMENLGALPAGFNSTVFIPLLKHPFNKVRLWAIKSLGKAANSDLLAILAVVAQEDTDSMVRREAVSSIGRLRHEDALPVLQKLLTDDDPKVVLQAVRGLLVFRANMEVMAALRPLIHHPNEIIREVIAQAFEEGNGRSAKPEIPHAHVPDYLKNVVVLGDVLPILGHIPDEVIHLTFTSPPYYNARDYSIYASYEAYLDFLQAVFEQVHRSTKEGRFLVVNTSPVIIPRVSRAHSSKRYPIPFDLHGRLSQIGWEFIDDIVWLKPETSVKKRVAGFGQHRKPLAYKPNAVTEYLMVYRKKTNKLLDWNMRAYDAQTVEASLVSDKEGKYESSNVWRVDPTTDRVHTAVFPIELCHRVIRYYSYKGDLVFDPFGGSGTLGRAAQNLERHFFMTEKEAVYVERMKQKLQTGAQFLSSDEFFILNASQSVSR